MEIIHAIILGAVQGITEFLPVSSSGHLVLLMRILDIENTSLFFEIMLHIGTLAAVIAVLWKELWALLKKPIQSLTGFLILGTLPAVIAALAFRGFFEDAFFTGRFLGISFLITSLLLALAEYLSRRALNAGIQSKKSMKIPDALAVGVMQAIAIIPGVSRSGATIAGALSLKLNRDFAARFSFLLSIPAIIGALLLHIMERLSSSYEVPAGGEAFGTISIIAGTLTAALVGFFAVRFMLKIIREKSLFIFAVYTGILGLAILLDQYLFGLIF